VAVWKFLGMTTTTKTTDQHFMQEILKADKFFEIPAAIQSRIFSSSLLSKIIRIEMQKYLWTCTVFRGGIYLDPKWRKKRAYKTVS